MTERNPGVPSRGETAIRVALNAVPWIGGSLDVVYERVMAQRRGSVDRFAEAAFSHFPGGAEDFLRRLTDDTRLAELFVSAAEAASRTTAPGKAAALGRMLAESANATEDAETDSAELLVHALIDLEWPHIKALSGLAQFPSDAQLYQEYGAREAQAVNDDERRKARFQLLHDLPSPVIAALLRHGLLSQDSGYGLYVDGVTDFGRAMLRYLEDEGWGDAAGVD